MKMIVLTLSILVFLVLPRYSQTIEQDLPVSLPHAIRPEIPDDEYIPVSPEEQQTSPAYRFEAIGILTTQVNVNEFGENILGDAANEPSIAVDPQVSLVRPQENYHHSESCSGNEHR